MCFSNTSFYRDYFIVTLKDLKTLLKKKINTPEYFSFEQAEMIHDILNQRSHFIKTQNSEILLQTLNNEDANKNKIEIPKANHQKTLLTHISAKNFLFAYTTPYFLNINFNYLTTRFLKRSNNSKNDSFFPLRLEENYLGIFRPSNKTLGLSSELIIADLNNEKISHDPKFRFIFSENISEIGVEIAKWGQKDTVMLLDYDNLQVLKLNLSKKLLD